MTNKTRKAVFQNCCIKYKKWGKKWENEQLLFFPGTNTLLFSYICTSLSPTDSVGWGIKHYSLICPSLSTELSCLDRTGIRSG